MDTSSPSFFNASLSLRLLIVCLLLWLTACDAGQATSQPYHHQVEAIAIQRQSDFIIERYFVGQVRSSQRAELGFEIAGTIAELGVDEGDKVSEGQLLARLDSSLLESEIDVIVAESEDLTSRRRLARRDLQRQRDLIRQGFASEQRIDELESELDSLAAQIKKQQALLAAAQTRLEKHSLRAPYTGEIAQLHREAGSVAVAGQPVALLLEKGSDEVRVGIPKRLLPELQVAEQVWLRVNDEDFQSPVLAVSSSVDSLTRTAIVRVGLPSEQNFIDGQLAYLALPERVMREGFWVPDTALSASVRGMWNVYALVQQAEGELSRIEARSVELLHMAHGRAFVNGAVHDGELLVATGVHRVLPGLSVRVADGVTQ